MKHSRKTPACLIFLPFLFLACGKSHKHKNEPQIIPETIAFTDPTPAINDWFNDDTSRASTGVNEVHSQQAFENEVIVAVIDTGIDTEHEDLKDQLWTNSKEIAGNGIDDDANGYVDDIHGWNYLVADDGTDISHESFEETREVARLRKLKETRELTIAESEQLALAETTFNARHLGGLGRYYYDLAYMPRTDDQADFNPISASNPARGNNRITDLNMHGTHVSGIIAAKRDNQIGINGIANKAKIMTLRVVPDGDERDKDIFHAIRYAVDNGARVINMSFGKRFSPYQNKVQEAFQYARDHNVLLVHAAGNDGLNMDENNFFPSRRINQNQEFNDSWLEVGAVGRSNFVNRLAYFTNYGETSVDLFAPGMDIQSTIPSNRYRQLSGTSMAAPVVSGIAALMISFDPSLKASELRTLIMESSRQQQTTQGKSISGGIIDASALFQAVKARKEIAH